MLGSRKRASALNTPVTITTDVTVIVNQRAERTRSAVRQNLQYCTVASHVREHTTRVSGQRVLYISKRGRSYSYLSMSKCDPMSKTSEAVVFGAYVPFALFNTGTYASKYLNLAQSNGSVLPLL
jgi:hypothetical protein